MSGRDAVMREASVKNGVLINYAHDLLMKAEGEITEYKGINARADSARMQLLVGRRDRIQDIKERIDAFVDNIYAQLLRAETDDSVQQLRITMESGFKSFESELKAIKEEMD